MIGRGAAQGLGTLWVLDASGKAIDCDAWSNIFNFTCWGGPGYQGSTAPGTDGSGAPAGTSGVDCSQFMNALTSPNCSLSNWTSSTFMLPVAAIAGVFILLSMRK